MPYFYNTGHDDPLINLSYTPISSSALLLLWSPPNNTISHSVYLDDVNVANTTGIGSPLLITEGSHTLYIETTIAGNSSMNVRSNDITVNWLGKFHYIIDSDRLF